MRRSIAILVLCTCTLMSCLSARGFYRPNRSGCGSLELIGEALYLRPTTCDLNFVIEDPTFFEREDTQLIPHGTLQRVLSDYDWGLRVGGSYLINCNCRDVRVVFSALSRSKGSRIDAPMKSALWPVFGHPQLIEVEGIDDALFNGAGPNGIPAFAQSDDRLEWYAVDGQLAARGYALPCVWMRGDLGLHWVQLRVRRETQYEGTFAESELQDEATVGFIKARASRRAWGIGPRLGGEARYRVACGFGITGRVGAGLLVGDAYLTQTGNKTIEQRITNKPAEEIETASLDVSNRDQTILFPEFDAALGVHYTLCNESCFSFYIEAGYEFRSYVAAVPRLVFYSVNAEGASLENCDSFNLDGLYLRAILEF